MNFSEKEEQKEQEGNEETDSILISLTLILSLFVHNSIIIKFLDQKSPLNPINIIVYFPQE